MKKPVLILLFFSVSWIAAGQKQFEITDGNKSNLVKQTDFFTFYINDSDVKETNRVYEGYLLSANKEQYEMKVFFEEYEKHDSSKNSLIIERCSFQEGCEKIINIRSAQISYFQHNRIGKVNASKFLFGFGAAGMIATSYFVFNPTLFDQNGVTNTSKKLAVVGGSMGFSLLSFSLALDLINPKKFYPDKNRSKNGGWYILEK